MSSYSHKNGSKWQANGKERQKREENNLVAQLIQELNDKPYVLTTRINFLNYVRDNCSIKDANVAINAWNTLMNQTPSNSSTSRETQSQDSSKEKISQPISSRVTRPFHPSNEHVPQQNHMKHQNYIPKVHPSKPKFMPKNQAQDIPRKDSKQFAREKIRHLQNKINFRCNMQDAFSEAQEKGDKKLLEELLLFEKNVPYTEERFKNFLKHNMKVNNDDLIQKIWTGIMFGFDEKDDCQGIKDSGYQESYQHGESTIEEREKTGENGKKSKRRNLPSDSDFFWDNYDVEYDSMDEIFAGVDFDKDN
uniref:Uncharacterized protein n=1 Tax=Acrobeloides nanus TaxID=290746 RepID=A0A914CQD9_9BILA